MNPRRDDAKRYQLYNKGYNDVQIAEACGVTKQTIAAWRMKKGLPPNGPVRERSVKKALIDQIHGYTNVRIDLTKVPVSDLRKLLRVLEIERADGC